MTSWIRARPVRTFRTSPSEAHNMFWELVRARRLGPKFRRQHALGPVVVDFYCWALRLVVELDGADDDRADKLRAAGMHVVRFRSDDVLHRPAEVVASLRTTIDARTAEPPPRYR